MNSRARGESSRTERDRYDGIVDDQRINSCLALAVQYSDRDITTIEGISHQLQAAFVSHDGFQCGYCTSGQICSAIGMLAEYEAGTPSAVTDHLAGPTSQLSNAEISSGRWTLPGA